MSVESVTQAVSNLALQFGDDEAGSGAMVGSFNFSNFLMRFVIVVAFY